MKKILKLQDHKHTAKVIDHKHTSYRGLFAVMAAFGVALIFVGKTVIADNYVVNARVAAPIPTVAAQINSPTNQSTATSQNIVISGTCPIINPSIVVVIYRGDTMIGSSGCSVSGEFSGTYSLAYGTNVITPKIMTITNDFGPDGLPVNITYPLPVTPVSPTQPTVQTNTGSRSSQQKLSGTTTQASADALQIKTDMPFIIFKQDQSVIWKLTINGGKSPYTILVDWGDDTKSTYAANSSGEQVLEHYFKQNKNTVVRVSVKDATGKEVYTSIAAVTFRQQSVAGFAQSTTQWSIPIGILWLLYAVMLAMIGAFWLGARVQHNVPIVVRNQKTNKHKN